MGTPEVQIAMEEFVPANEREWGEEKENKWE